MPIAVSNSGIPLSVYIQIDPEDSKYSHPDGGTVERLGTNEVRLATSSGANEMVHQAPFVYEDGGSLEEDIGAVGEHMVERLIKDQFLGEQCNVALLFGGASSTRKGMFFNEISKLVLNLMRESINENGKVTISCAEIYDEVVQDLLRADNRDLELGYEASRGAVIEGLTTVEYSATHLDDSAAALDKAISLRTDRQTDAGNTKDATSTIFTIEVYDNSGEDNAGPVICTRCILFELLGIEKLQFSQSNIHMKESPSLSSALFETRNLVDKIIRFQETNRDDAPSITLQSFAASKVTWLLSNVLASNCVTETIFHVAKGQHLLNKIAVNLATQFSKLEHHTIIDNSPISRGLERIYRTYIKRLQEDVDKAQKAATSNAGVKENTELNMKIKKLEKKSLEHKQENLALTTECDRYAKKLETLMGKYQVLVQEKYNLEEQVISAEESKLKVSKAMLGLKLKNTKLVEQAAEKNIELQQRAMQTEHEMLKAQTSLASAEAALKETEDDAKQLKARHTKLELELLNIKENYQSRDADYKSQVQENTELNVEIINLKNEKDSVEAELSTATKERDRLAAECEQLSTNFEKQTLKMEQLEKNFKMIQSTAAELREEKVKAELQLKKVELDLQEKTVHFDRELSTVTRETDMQLDNIRKGREEDSKSAEAAREAADAQIKLLNTKNNKNLRQIAEMTKKLRAVEGENRELLSAQENQDRKIQQLEQDYRQKLQDIVDDENEDEHTVVAKERIDSLKRELAVVKRQNATMLQRNHKMIRNVRQVEEAYTEARNALEDAGHKDLQTLEDIFANAKFSEIESQLKASNEKLKSDLKERERELDAIHEKLFTTSEVHKKQIQELKTELKAANSELAILKRSSGNHEVLEMQRRLERQLQALENRPAPQPTQQPGGMSSFEQQQLQRENMRMKDEIRKLREQAMKNIGSGGAADVSGGGGPMDNAKMKELQKKNVKLLTEKTVLEEQLKSFKDYMKTEAARNQKVIKKLKKELSYWKKEAKKKGVADPL